MEKYFFSSFCYYFATKKSYFFFENFVLKGKKMRDAVKEEEKNKYLSWISYFITLLTSLSKMSLLIFPGEILGDSISVIRKILLHFPDDLICATWGEALCSFDLLNHRTRTWPGFSFFVHPIEPPIEKEL